MTIRLIIGGLLILALIFSFIPFTTDEISIRYIFSSLSHLCVSGAAAIFTYMVFKNNGLKISNLSIGSEDTPLRFYGVLSIFSLIAINEIHLSYLSLVLFLKG
jgi:hypothetical protein